MDHSDGLQRYALTVLSVVLTVVALYFGKQIILLIVGSGLLAFLLVPLSRGLERWMPRWAGALLATLIMLFAVLGVLFFIGWQFSRFGSDLPQVQERLAAKGQDIQRWISENTNLSRREQVAWFNSHMGDLASMGGNAAVEVFKGTGNAVASLAPLPIFVFLLLLLRERFRTFFIRLGKTREGAILDIMLNISALSRRYLRGLLTTTFLFATLCSIGFLIVGLKYAILLGVLLAFLNLIPYVGALVGSLLPVAVSLLTKGSIPHAVAALGVVLVVQFLDNNFITPKVVGSSVSINPLASLLALIGFGMLWGVAGMLLAIPVTGMLKVVCDSVPSLKAWGYLLGEDIETPHEKRLHLHFPSIRSSAKKKG